MPRHIVFIAMLAFAAPALAQDSEPATGGALLGRIYNSVMPHAPESPTADFVQQSRPRDLQYRPFDPTPEKVDRRKTAEEMQRITSQLEAAAAANRQKAARVGVPDAPAPGKRRR